MRNLFYLGAVLTGFAGFALADDEKVPKPRPSITAVRVEQLPVLDGVLDEAAWQAAPVAGDFVQQDPDNGEPITERTEFRVLYDDKALYIGVWCYDSEPDEIIARSMMRDDYPYEDDHLYIAIDSFLDYRNGYAFATNPNSCRWDGLIINNSYTGGSWDAIWECKSRITGEGWFSEIAIPFNSISFDPNQTAWGLNISRTIRRKNETGRWHNPPRQLWTSSVSDAGEIRGLNNLSQDSKWELLPYGMGKYRHNHDLNDGSTLGDFGGDISYKLAPNLSASLSANTDFAETEVDSRQLNFSRFSLFYPEKRDFFLRDSGIFRFGSLSRSSSVPTIPFFSRRIGLTENQRPVPINLAAKVTGRIGKYSIGIIDAQIDGHDGIGSQNAFVTRVSRNVLEQSSVGLITTIGNPNSEEDAYLIGTDFNYRTTRFLTDKTLRASVYALANYDESSDWSEVYGGSLSYPNDLLDGGLAFYEVGEDFQPKLGYTRRTGVRNVSSRISYRPRPENIEWLRKYHLSYRNSFYTTLDNDIESQQHSFYIPYLDFESGYELYFKIDREYDRPEQDFEISGGAIVPAGEYWTTDYTIDFELKESGILRGDIGYTFGEWYHGDKQTAYLELGFNPAKWLDLRLEYSYNQFELPELDFDAHIASGRLRINFTPDMGWSHLVQYDSVSESVGYNTRYFWEFQPGKKFHVVLRQNYGNDHHLFSLRESEFVLKAVTTFRL